MDMENLEALRTEYEILCIEQERAREVLRQIGIKKMVKAIEMTQALFGTQPTKLTANQWRTRTIEGLRAWSMNDGDGPADMSGPVGHKN